MEDTDLLVSQVSFTIVRDNNDDTTVSRETDRVFVQLRNGEGENSNWVECDLESFNTAVCDTLDLEFIFSDTNEISVVAYSNQENTPPPVPEVTVTGAFADYTRTIDGNNYRIVEWRNTNGTSLDPDGSITIPEGETLNVEYLVVGGGGGGGRSRGGGGGAGGFLTNVGEGFMLLQSATHSVTVGAGGAGGIASGGANGGDGAASSISAVSVTGGGGGGSPVGTMAGRSGGSGGGGGGQNPVVEISTAGGVGVSGEGNSGGSGHLANNQTGAGGGGGGAGGMGVSAVAGKAGNGGNGLPSSITGILTMYAGGGGGGIDERAGAGAPGIGGSGGGGNGAEQSPGTAPVPGGDGLGGGGGGGRQGTSANDMGAKGGDGVVVIRWKIGGGPIFSPLSMSPALWLDAAEGSTMIAPLSRVSNWKDKSGNGRDGTQIDDSRRPSIGTRTINGRNVLDFDGVNDNINIVGFTLPQPISIFAVVAKDTNTNGRIFQGGIIGSILAEGRPYASSSSVNYYGDFNSALDTIPHVMRYIFNGTSSSIYVDGIQSGSTGNVGSSGITDPFSIGSPTQQFWNGVIGEVLVFDRILSVDEINVIESYLFNKWDL